MQTSKGPASLFGIGQTGKSTNVTSQFRQNCYLEMSGDPERSAVAVYGTPGLANFGGTPYGTDQKIRGMHVVGGLLFVLFNQIGGGGFNDTISIWSFNEQGVANQVYISSPVPIAGDYWLYSVDDGGKIAWLLPGTTTGTGKLLVYDLNARTGSMTTVGSAVLANHNTITWLDGYAIVGSPETSRWYISPVNNITGTWDALDFATAESNPDYMVRVFADHGELMLFGTRSTEFWANTGGQDFPFTRIQGASCEWGCAAAKSIAKFENSVMFLAQNQQGQIMVARMNGYQPQKVSTFDLDYQINRYGTVSDAEGFSYMLGGHPMYQINFPTADISWLYDGSTNLWSRVKSYGIGRHRAQMGVALGNKMIVADYVLGKLYELTPNSTTDAGSLIEMEIVTRHVASNNDWMICDEIELLAETGVGSQDGSDPQIMLQISKDGGHSWGHERWTSLGKVGKTKTRVFWQRCGRARDWTFKFRITDDCKRVLQNGILEMRPGAQ